MAENRGTCCTRAHTEESGRRQGRSLIKTRKSGTALPPNPIPGLLPCIVLSLFCQSIQYFIVTLPWVAVQLFVTAVRPRSLSLLQLAKWGSIELGNPHPPTPIPLLLILLTEPSSHLSSTPT